MADWGALWRVPAGSAIPVAVNPQGVTAAPVGTLAVSPCGHVYIKTGGGSTPFGWYLFNSPQWIQWQPRHNGQFVVNGSAQTLSFAPATTISSLPMFSTAGGSFDAKRQYASGYTSAVAANSILYRLANNVDFMPNLRMDNSLLDNFVEFDLYWDIITTPRQTAIATSTDMTGIRIWAGCAWGAAVVQAVGGTVSSDTLATEWPTVLVATDNLFGMAFRFSTVAGDAGWACVTTRRTGGAYAQTVTPMGVAALGNSAYRLRMRCVFVAGVLTVLASVNDGTEIAITGNVGPVAPFTAATQPFQPLMSVRNIPGVVLKSIGMAQCSLNYGLGVGLTC